MSFKTLRVFKLLCCPWWRAPSAPPSLRNGWLEIVTWVIHGHHFSGVHRTIVFLYENHKQCLSSSRTHCVKKDEVLPHDIQMCRNISNLFKQCSNQGTQSLTMPVSNFFKFTCCRSEHMERDRNGSNTMHSDESTIHPRIATVEATKIGKTYILIYPDHPVLPVSHTSIACWESQN